MIRAYKFLMRPTVGQAQALAEMLRDHCSLYNGALQERRDAYQHVSKTSITYIAHEDLKIRNMVRTPAPRPDPDQSGAFLPNGASAKAGLNRSVSDAGWGVFLTILRAKAESAGREVIAVDPRNTSRACPACGHTAKENRPTQERFHCQECGHQAHADTVAAIDVLRAGLVRRDARKGWREAPGPSRGRSHEAMVSRPGGPRTVLRWDMTFGDVHDCERGPPQGPTRARIISSACALGEVVAACSLRNGAESTSGGSVAPRLSWPPPHRCSARRGHSVTGTARPR
jgi:predicted RNA-binding Zn-ribbon protein involved in translation (DUF1610 family)